MISSLPFRFGDAFEVRTRFDGMARWANGGPVFRCVVTSQAERNDMIELDSAENGAASETTSTLRIEDQALEL